MVENLLPGDDENEVEDEPRAPSAALDSAHVGDIQGAFGTIKEHDLAARRSWGKSSLPFSPSSGQG